MTEVLGNPLTHQLHANKPENEAAGVGTVDSSSNSICGEETSDTHVNRDDILSSLNDQLNDEAHDDEDEEVRNFFF